MEASIQNLSGIEFYDKLDSYLETPIPEQIKRILLLNDYDCLAVLKDFNDGSLADVQQYMRNVFDATMVDPNKESVKDYLGRFEKCQPKFEFTAGQKQWLTIIVKKCREFKSPPPIRSVSNVTEDEIEALRQLLQNWTCGQEPLIESLKRDFRFEIIETFNNSVKLRCPSRTCNHLLTATRKGYESSYKRKTPGVSKVGNAKWHVSCIQQHLRKYHKVHPSTDGNNARPNQPSASTSTQPDTPVDNRSFRPGTDGENTGNSQSRKRRNQEMPQIMPPKRSRRNRI